MRYSTFFFSLVFIGILAFGLLLNQAAQQATASNLTIAAKAGLVRTLQLTDLCLFTEARYTRHLSQADLNTPYQDHPLSLEHFPSGSFTQPTIAAKSP